MWLARCPYIEMQFFENYALITIQNTNMQYLSTMSTTKCYNSLRAYFAISGQIGHFHSCYNEVFTQGNPHG